MISVFLSVLQTLRTWAHSRAELQLEILALRHQLQVLQRTRPRRVRVTTTDRCLWVVLSRVWTWWRTGLVIVKPATVIAWHRRGFRLWWTWKSRRRMGRPTVAADIRTLIRTMAQANPRWGAPRIHGELLKLGIDVCQATVAKYMGRRRHPPSQTWCTFLQNHIGQIVAADFFVVPTVTYRLLFVLVLLAHDRRRIRHIAVTAHPTSAWTAQQLREAFPWDDTCSTIAIMRSTALGPRRRRWGLKRCSRHCMRLGKCNRRAIHRIRTSRVSRSCDRVQRSGPAAADDSLLFVLRTVPHALIAGQRYADSSPCHVGQRWFCRRGDPGGRWLASSLRTARGLNTRRAAGSARTSNAHRLPGTILLPRQHPSSDLVPIVNPLTTTLASSPTGITNCQ